LSSAEGTGGGAPSIRPLAADDATAAAAIMEAAFAQLSRRHGEEPRELSVERRQGMVRRIGRFAETDGPGCWVAEADGTVVGLACSIRREHLWGLSLLFVHPDQQSARLGTRLVERTRPYAEGADVEVIMASDDPRAIRRYASYGLALHPAMGIKGEVDRRRLPGGLDVRAGAVADLDLVEDVDRRLRGVPRTADVSRLLDDDVELVIVDGPRRGFAVHSRQGITMLGADDEATARTLLWACLAEIEGEVEQWGLTASQGWAFDVALAAALKIAPAGPMFLRGLPAVPGPYLPSGIYF
jgi:GNAT superfamily N-acetyltransferase